MRIVVLLTVSVLTGALMWAPVTHATAPADIAADPAPTVAQWGTSDQGQFGDSRGEYASWPVLVDWGIDVAKVVDGHSEALAVLATDGTVWVAGPNHYGELGYNTLPAGGDISWDLIALPGINDAVDVFQSSQSGFVLRANGELWSWGREHYGIRGSMQGDFTPRLMPGLPEDLVQVSPGSFHALALDSSGQVWSWGRNDRGQAGHHGGAVPAVVDFPEVGGQDVVIERVIGAHQASYALDTEGRLWAWGDNRRGQLGLGDNTDRHSPQHVAAVSAVVDLIATTAAVWAVDASGGDVP